MKKGNVFPFDPDAFLTGTVEMSNEQKGIYITLLSYQWTLNGLPSDENKLARFCFCECNAIASVLHKFPICNDGLRRNSRLEEDRTKREDRSAAQAANAYQRWGRKPSSDEAKRLADIFHRRHSTEWSEKEVLAFRKLKDAIALPDLEIIARYYEAERTKGDEGIFRRDLATFLNNYLGELDRARQWEAGMKRKSANLNGSTKPALTTPAGFMPWLCERYPDRAPNFATQGQVIRDSLIKQWREETA